MSCLLELCDTRMCVISCTEERTGAMVIEGYDEIFTMKNYSPIRTRPFTDGAMMSVAGRI